MSTPIRSAADLVKFHEGFVSPVKADRGGCPVGGYGHDSMDLHIGEVVTQEQGDSWFPWDLDLATKDAATAVNDREVWEALGEPRQASVIDMAFNLGLGRLIAFKTTLSMIRLGDFDGASNAMLDSKWAEEVPNRAKMDAEIMRTGDWPA